MIIRILSTGTTVSIRPDVARVIRVYNHRVPVGILASTFTAAGELLGSTADDTPAVITSPAVEGQILRARLSNPLKMAWETVDLSQLTLTAVKTAAYTAANGDHVLVNSSSASADFAITLPASPADGTKVRVSLVAGHATYKVTIGRNSSLIMGSTDTSYYDMRTAGDSYYFEYTGATLGWVVIPPNKRRSFGLTVQSGALTTGDNKVKSPPMPSFLNGMNLVAVEVQVDTKSTSGTPTFQIARGRQASAGADYTYNDVLSTSVTIDANEYSSRNATTPYAINASYDDVATGDIYRVDIDVAGTGTQTARIIFEFQ